MPSSDAEAVLADYYSAFSTLNVQAILPYFCEPTMFVGPQGVFAASTYVELVTPFGSAMDALRARGFGRSELIVRHTHSLSATAILISGVAHRFKVDGEELERVGVTYVLHNSANAWKIAVLIIHDI
jgi:hypothetical protein